MMRYLILLLTLLFAAAACQESDSTAPIPSPDFAKGGKPNCEVDPSHPKCKEGGDGGATAEVVLCAKKPVVDAINAIDERTDPEPWDYIDSTGEGCECGPWSEYCPTGTLTYSTSGPAFAWKFNGTGFVSINHKYVLIYFRDPWPGRGLICLEEDVTANRGGKIRFSGSKDLGMTLEDAKIWIVRSKWVDCDGTGFHRGPNPDAVPRLTNDRDGDGIADATESCSFPFGTPPYPCDDARKVYDWLFERAPVQYDDTDIH